MKKILLMTLVVCLSLTLGALTPVTAAQIKQGGAMTVTYKDDISTLDPAIGYDWQNWSMIKALFNGLMDYAAGTYDSRTRSGQKLYHLPGRQNIHV